MQLIKNAYMAGIHGVFVSYAVLAAILFLSSLSVEDYGLSGGTFKMPSADEGQTD